MDYSEKWKNPLFLTKKTADSFLLTNGFFKQIFEKLELFIDRTILQNERFNSTVVQ